MTRTRRQGERVRIHLDVPVRVKKRFEKLMKMMDADSMTETFRRCLRMAELVAGHQKRMGRVILRRGDKEQELIIL